MIGRQGHEHSGLGLVDNGICHPTADPRAARNSDLMLQRCLDQHAQQVVILEDRAALEDWPGDFDLVQRQKIHQGGGCPFRMGQPFRKRLSHLPLGSTGKCKKYLAKDR
jgi:hypothetical protein